MVLPLGFCCCYIKTAQMCNAEGEKGLWRWFLDTTNVCWISWIFFPFFFCFCYFNVFCRLGWLALSRSNNMAECFDKNSGASVRFLRMNLEDVGSLQSRNQHVRWVLTRARSRTFPVLLHFPLCREEPKKQKQKQINIISDRCSQNETSGELTHTRPHPSSLLVISLWGCRGILIRWLPVLQNLGRVREKELLQRWQTVLAAHRTHTWAR